MAATTSDKVGWVAAVVGAILMALFVLWPSLRRGKAAPPAVPSPGFKAEAVAAEPAPADNAVDSKGDNALAGGVVDGAAVAVRTPAPVSEPIPLASNSARVVRLLDEPDQVII